MGGTKTLICFEEACPRWTEGNNCDSALEVRSTTNVETGEARRRVVCGQVIGELAQKHTDAEILGGVMDERVPTIVDEVVGL